MLQDTATDEEDKDDYDIFVKSCNHNITISNKGPAETMSVGERDDLIQSDTEGTPTSCDDHTSSNGGQVYAVDTYNVHVDYRKSIIP